MAVRAFVRPTRGTRPRVLRHTRTLVANTSRVYLVITYRTQAISAFVPRITVTGIDRPDSTTLVLTLSEPVKNNAAVQLPAIYVVTPDDPDVDDRARLLVTAVDAGEEDTTSSVTLTVEEMVQAAVYNLEILQFEAPDP